MDICKKNKKNQVKKANGDILNYYNSNMAINNTENNFVPESLKNILFILTNQNSVTIEIDSEKTMSEAIKLYFEKIKRTNLFGDKAICFLKDGRIIEHYSKQLVKDCINKKNNSQIIIVVDSDDKIGNLTN